MLTVLDEFIEDLPNPLNIIEQLDQYIIGQQEAKKNLGVLLLVRALMKLQKNGKIPRDIEIQKSNLLLIGPTGCGKTALMKALSHISGVPIIIRDVTGITSAGYIGGKIEDILVEYIDYVHDNTDYPNASDITTYTDRDASVRCNWKTLLEAISTGIIYLDEIDKLLSRSDGQGTDVTGDMVQNELLKVLEGEVVKLTNSRLKYPKCNVQELNTKYITFICGGAFSGLSSIINNRLTKAGGIGFGAELNKYKGSNNNLLSEFTTDDLLKYGFKAEFLGRLPLKSNLDELTLPIMIRVITEPNDCIYKRYKAFFNLFGKELLIEEHAIKEIAQKALDLKMGARSLHQIFNDLFINDLVNIFETKSMDLKISKSTIKQRLK